MSSSESKKVLTAIA